ncbi:MAG: hypothetical protein DRZ82_08790 [Thermoprotei archaeon]|nr:MAG: hypothetical protein DRZ82_08790 [Thermoprotei archaeon]
MREKPAITVIVVNYNSRKKWDVIEQCIRNILLLKYRPLEVIFVDNGSTDGSYEFLEGLVNDVLEGAHGNFRVRIIRLSKNYGFAIANLIAYKLRNTETKYVALINNDLAPKPDSLERLVSILERNPRIAGIQGIILSWDGKRVDSYGGLTTDHGFLYAVSHSLTPHALSKPIPVTYVDGAFSIYRVDALERCGGLFLPYFFMWGDDYELGVRLWRCGYILLAVPIIVGRHYRGLTVGRQQMPYILEYWSWVSNIAVMVVLYGHPWVLQVLKRVPTALAAGSIKHSKAIVRGFIDGLRIGVKLRRRMLKEKPWLKVPKEPRLSVKIFHELALLARLFLKHGFKASRVYYIGITRSLGKAFVDET